MTRSSTNGASTEDDPHGDRARPKARGLRGRLREALHTIKAGAMAAVNADPGPGVVPGETRVQIGDNYAKQPLWKIGLGVPFIYVPILTTVPFVIPTVWLVKTHLRALGGMNLKGYWDFVPNWVTHRYNYHTQITCDTRSVAGRLSSLKVFWIFNCKLYCPMSVGLFSYTAYLVKIVENFWCPFDHGTKRTYGDAPIDKSFWHATDEAHQLHPDDASNAIWNHEAARPASAP